MHASAGVQRPSCWSQQPGACADAFGQWLSLSLLLPFSFVPLWDMQVKRKLFDREILLVRPCCCVLLGGLNGGLTPCRSCTDRAGSHH